MSDQEAFESLKVIRWADNNGEPYCPRCGCIAVYVLATRRLWKCKGCLHQFSLTSGTIFASRKLPIRDYLLVIALFVSSAKGHSALQLSRELDIQYRSAFVILHKLREVLADELQGMTLQGKVEIDGAYFGGYLKPPNRRQRWKSPQRSPKQKVVVVARERAGRTITTVAASESASVAYIRQRLELGSVLYADEAGAWNVFHAEFDTRRINHSVCYSDFKACTNQAESFFSRLRRSEIGVHHHISNQLSAYAAEMAWRETNSRVSASERYNALAGLAIRHPASSSWRGYWQRGREKRAEAA